MLAVTGIEAGAITLAGTAITAMSAVISARLAARGSKDAQFGQLLNERDARLWRAMEAQVQAHGDKVAAQAARIEELEAKLDAEQEARIRLEARLDSCPAAPCPLRPAA